MSEKSSSDPDQPLVPVFRKGYPPWKNPIHKVVDGYAVDIKTGKSRSIRSWAGTCPLCGQMFNDSGIGRGTTRKRVKDRLHKHLKSDHGGPEWVCT